MFLPIAWLAAAEEYPPDTGRWIKRDVAGDYAADLAIYQIREIDSGCLVLDSWTSADEIRLHLPTCNEVTLNRADVVGMGPVLVQ